MTATSTDQYHQAVTDALLASAPGEHLFEIREQAADDDTRLRAVDGHGRVWVGHYPSWRLESEPLPLAWYQEHCMPIIAGSAPTARQRLLDALPPGDLFESADSTEDKPLLHVARGDTHHGWFGDKFGWTPGSADVPAYSRVSYEEMPHRWTAVDL